MNNLDLHPLCTLFPRLSGHDFECLKFDIKDHGQREPIIIHDGMILDGGNRYRACVELGIEPQTMKFGGGNIVNYVLSVNLHRRHLTAGQQAAIVASVQDWAKAQTSSRPKKECNLAPLSTSKDRAAQSGASIRTQKMADKVAKDDPVLSAEVARGEKTLPEAVEQLTGVRPGRRKAPPTRIDTNAPDEAPPPIDEQQELIDGLNMLVEDLYQQVDDLKNQLAAGADADHKTRLDELTAEVKNLTARNKNLTRTRDTLMNEKASMRKQLEAQARKLKKLEGEK